MNPQSKNDSSSLLPPLKFNGIQQQQPRTSFQQSPRIAHILSKQNFSKLPGTNNFVHQPLLPQNNKIPGLNSPRAGIIVQPKNNPNKRSKRIILAPLDINYQPINNSQNNPSDVLSDQNKKEIPSSILVENNESTQQIETK